MRPLVLCQSCRRHVKVSESQCPFCSAAVVRPRNQDTGVARGLPGGRAALFLTGALVAAGCADEHEPDGLDDDTGKSDAGNHQGTKDAGMVVPPYGVVIPPDGGTRVDAGYDAGLIAQPYGIPIHDASIVTPKDAGPSCPQIGNLPAPVYGIGIDPRPIDLCRDAGSDAGAADAGKDAGSDAGADAGKDSGIIAVPPYGIAVPAYGIAVDPKP